MSDIQAIIGDAFENRADITPRNVSTAVRDAVTEAIEQLERKLDLTSEQKVRVAAIVDRRHTQAREQFRRHRQALQALQALRVLLVRVHRRRLPALRVPAVRPVPGVPPHRRCPNRRRSRSSRSRPPQRRKSRSKNRPNR